MALIRQNLGLGVLEEKSREGDESDTSSGERSVSSCDENTKPEQSRKESYVLDKLMGNKSKKKKPTIEEMIT